MSTYSTYSPRLHKHGSHELHHTFHNDIPFFGEDIGPRSFRDWMWDTEKLVQPLFSKYSQFDILRHVTSMFIGHASEWWQERQYRVKKGRKSCINTFYALKACMWKHFIPLQFRITKEQQSRIEDFIDIGDAVIQNLAKFSRLEKYFKNNLDLLLSEKREREKQKRAREKLEKFRELDMQRVNEKLEKLRAEKKKREQEEYEKNEKKKRDEEEKAKDESLRKANEENERKELEEREKIRQESELEIQLQVVELKSISKAKREHIVRDLVYHPSPIPSMMIKFPKGVLPSLNSSHFVIKSFVLFPSQTFCSPSHSLISYASSYCAKTQFDF